MTSGRNDIPTCDFQLSLSELLNECMSQTAVDFMGLRSANEQTTDESYDDFVLTSDSRLQFFGEVESISAWLNIQISSFINSQVLDDDILMYSVLNPREITKDTISRLFFDYFKYRILVWWYKNRNVDLYTYYLQQANDAYNLVSTSLINKFTTRRCRYF